MMNKVLVAFALKEEFAPWRRRHRFSPVASSPYPAFMTSFGSTEIYVALAGAGAPQAHFFQEMTTQFNPSLGIVTGVAAGLKPEWRPGDMLVARTVSGPDGEEQIRGALNLIDLAVQCGAKPAPMLITVPHIARTLEKKAHLATVGDAADMESLPLMQQWSDCGIPSLALRVILDPVEMPMTCDFEAAMDPHGQVRITQILAQLARRPQLLADFLPLARQSRRVLKILARFLDLFFAQLDRQSPDCPSP
jgi:nucleoside phosphorylase